MSATNYPEIPDRCPHCGSPQFTRSQVYRCGYVDGHIQTDRCIERQSAQSTATEDEIERRRLGRHFGDEHAEVY